MITGGLKGVDYAFPPRPDLTVLRQLGQEFIIRYGGPGTADKQLDPAEAAEATRLGFKIVANAEGSADGLLHGFSIGVSWAKLAEAHFERCGMPAGRPIYFSADVNVTAAQWPAVADGLRGAASVVGLDRVGLYGHYNCVRWGRRDDVARWFWQTYAWSGGNWAPGNHVEQHLNGVTLAGADCDLDRAIDGDFGQWSSTLVPAARSTGMITLKVRGDDHPAIYRSNGEYRWHITDYATFEALNAAGVPHVVVDTDAQLDDAGGPLVGGK